jgi:predicted RNase H-like nuclease (RuvC/YqgF family)
MGKILIFASIVVSLATAGLGFINKGKLGDTVAEIDVAKQEATQAKQELASANSAVDTAKEDVASLTSEKEQALSQAASAEEKARQAGEKVSELETQISQKEGEISKLTADIEAKETEIANLKTQTETTTTEPTEDVTAMLQEKETLIAKLQGDLDAAKAQLSDLRQRETDRQQLRMRDGLTGRILAVNQAWNFVVLNLGDKNGVVNNAEMLVKRGNSLIGKVRITSVEPATSIADIVSGSVPQGVAINPGDNVIFQAVGGNEL